MTTSQYFRKLLDLSHSENEYEDADLESNIAKIMADTIGSLFNLAVLFEKPVGDKEAVINSKIIEQIVNILGLLFVNQKGREGNVCFANNPDLRPEFRQSFTVLDLLDYSNAVLHSNTHRKGNTDFFNIPISADVVLFWQLVQIGSNLRNTEE